MRFLPAAFATVVLVSIAGIVAANSPPDLAPLTNQSVLENATIFLQLQATDPDNDSLTFGIDGSALLSPFSFDPQTGLFSWTPTFTDYGSYPVTFSASDGIATDTETIWIHVRDASLATIVLAGTPASGETVVFQLSDPAAPGQVYVLALAFNTTPGIPLHDGRTFPLSDDILFDISLLFPYLIGLDSSVGILDQSGNANVTWTIPTVSALKNKTVYAAYGTFNPSIPLPNALISISPAIPVAIA